MQVKVAPPPLVVSDVNAAIAMTVVVLPVVVSAPPLAPLVQKPKPLPLLKSNRLLLLNKPKAVFRSALLRSSFPNLPF